MSIVFAVNDVVPHKKTMSLLDEVVEYDDETLTAKVVIRENTLFLENGKVPAYLGIEYMAQSIAAFAGVQECVKGGEAKIGFLVGTRKYSSEVSSFPLNAVLMIHIEREFQADNGLGVFNCSISSESKKLASCVLNVFQPDDAEEFLAVGSVGS